ncbi:NtaA/DmoA family FMN-dependent monooxygenase [Pseudonocardia kongjuensis]|uniref:NtaA/DmoA family FMN-dependent monooxygenase n=1 Tax=Pseudonocardia kongjuensis TaxID=102227 RepID=A0ABP4I7K5_9PSEU
MSTDMFHLGWFLEGSSAQAWNQEYTGFIGRDWMRPDLMVDVARSLERAGFDYVLLEDTSWVPDTFGGSSEVYLRHAIATPRQDPALVAAVIAQATTRLGIVPTLGTYAYPPYQLARLVGTLDQVSAGRIGWNVVTGSSDGAARNFGRDAMPEHDERYVRAHEYLDVVNRLWGSWEQDAILDDTTAGVFADPAKVHTVDHTGKYFSVRGPLNSGPVPQGRPVIAQAGGSPAGKSFAAAHADTIVSTAKGVEEMKAFRDDVRARMVAAGRDPDDCKVLFLTSPVVGLTEDEATQRRRARHQEGLDQAAIRMFSQLAKTTNIDFSVYDLDQPLDTLDFATNGHQHMLGNFVARAGAKPDATLREISASLYGEGSIDFTGTHDSVAGRMCEVMQEVGGDGFLLVSYSLSRRHIAEITEGLVPALQRRGAVRSRYAHATFRDNLLEF